LLLQLLLGRLLSYLLLLAFCWTASSQVCIIEEKVLSHLHLLLGVVWRAAAFNHGLVHLVLPARTTRQKALDPLPIRLGSLSSTLLTRHNTAVLINSRGTCVLLCTTATSSVAAAWRGIATCKSLLLAGVMMIMKGTLIGSGRATGRPRAIEERT